MAIDIIKGEQYAITGGNPNGGFLDVGAVVGEAADKVLKVVDKERAQAQVASNRRRVEAEKANRRISSYLSKMKSGSDIEGLNKEQNKVIKDFLVNKKNTYVQAANKLATMSPGDAGYMEQVDIMNSVNQDITNLSNISKTYKLNQKDLLEDYQENLLSMGDPLKLNQAASIYDPSAIFSLDENGSMIFDVNGQKIDYADFNNPAPKATSSATSILKLTDNVYNSSFKSGQALNQYKLANIRSQIEEVVGGNPDIARSLVMDKLLTNTPLAIDEEDYNDPDKLQTTLVNDIMEGILAASNKGVSDYNGKNGRTGIDSAYMGPDGAKFSRSYEKTKFKNGIEQDHYKGADGKMYYRPVGAPMEAYSLTPYTAETAAKLTGTSTPTKTDKPTETNTSTPMGDFDGSPINLNTNQPIEPPTQNQLMEIMGKYPQLSNESGGDYQKRIYFLYSQAMTNGEKDESGLYQLIK